MKIGVISDTHIPERAEELPKEIFLAFKDVNLILHAGDFIELTVLDKLKEISQVKAVYGNMDMPEVRNVLAQKEIIEVGKFKIGLIHGWGPPDRLIETIKKEFPQKINAIVFGSGASSLKSKHDETFTAAAYRWPTSVRGTSPRGLWLDHERPGERGSDRGLSGGRGL